MNPINAQQLIAQMQALANLARGTPETGMPEGGAQGFADLLRQSLDAVNTSQQEAGRLAQAFERGDPQVELAQVMIARQKASISFQAMTQVRNKLVEAYHDIKNMPI